MPRPGAGAGRGCLLILFVALVAAAGCADGGETTGPGGDETMPSAPSGSAIAMCIRQCEVDHPVAPAAAGSRASASETAELVECWQRCSTKLNH